jgi:hypothetical protein
VFISSAFFALREQQAFAAYASPGGGGAGEVGFPAGIETIQECPYDLLYPYRVIIKKVAIQSK